MPVRPVAQAINASTIKILNTLRANLPQSYQQYVGDVSTLDDIPKVGDVILGTPGLANMFLGALMNRIAFVAIKSATFNNKFASLKKGYLTTGEIVEEVFVEMCKAVEFNPEKGAAREHARYLPDVKSAMHFTNYRVMYPVTISRQQLKGAFTSANGVADLISTIFKAVYQAAEYDEFLLFKYLIIKAVAAGKMYPITFDASDMKDGAKKFRGTSNQLEFISNKYNTYGVRTNTNRADQYIFMDAAFNAEYDVDVLASAFNMDKATFMGNLILVDSFTEFDNDRFSKVREGSDQISEVTASELSLMSDVKAVLVDKEWFQIYDVEMTMVDTPTMSALEWNYFLHVWKMVSSSPFSNAIAFVDDGASITNPDSITVTVASKDVNEEGIAVAFTVGGVTGLTPTSYQFTYSDDSTMGPRQVGGHIAITPYGAVFCPDSAKALNVPIDVILNGVRYSTYYNTASGVSKTITYNGLNVGGSYTLAKQP